MERDYHASAEGTSLEPDSHSSFDHSVGWELSAVLALVAGCAAALALQIPTSALLGAACVIGSAAQILQARRLRKWGEQVWATARGAVYAMAGVVLIAWHLPAMWVGGVMLVVIAVAARTLRKAGILAALRFGWWWSRRTSAAGVVRLRRWALAGAAYLTPGRPIAARTMRRAGVYRPGLAKLFLERGADQMEMLMHIARAGFEESGVAQRFVFDDSVRHLKDAHAVGRGVVVIAPHLCGYPIIPRVLQDVVPCGIFLRRSPSSSKHAINQAIARAGGGQLVFVPEHTPPTEQLGIAMRILREGRALFITPDVPRKPDGGVPARIFGRTAYFPTGTFLMAMRTGAPIVSLLWHHENGRYHVRCAKPYTLSPAGERRARLARAVADFGREMDAFLHEHPEMWWNWLDKRWIRIMAHPAEPGESSEAPEVRVAGAAIVAREADRERGRHEKLRA